MMLPMWYVNHAAVTKCYMNKLYHIESLFLVLSWLNSVLVSTISPASWVVALIFVILVFTLAVQLDFWY